MLKYQNYKHYKLPITMEPLKYGHLLYQNNNIYILQFNRTNVTIITQDGLNNHIKFFKEGNLIYEYKDFKLSHNSFVRSVENRKFTFENGNLVSINKIVLLLILIILILFINIFDSSTILDTTLICSTNIIKLRKVKSNYN
jgi:hypothetical protein